MLQHTGRRLPETDSLRPDLRSDLRSDLREVQQIVQATLDKVRILSHTLHPMILDEIGFEGALDQYLPGLRETDGHRRAI